jgi:hypothetical protein
MLGPFFVCYSGEIVVAFLLYMGVVALWVFSSFVALWVFSNFVALWVFSMHGLLCT